ncbi:MAG TPA: hypothetical protein PKV21_04450 [bacterium]|nr:hypothetical protein [bacterium]HOM26738.1 hypothetical protein [bacterium]
MKRKKEISIYHIMTVLIILTFVFSFFIFYILTKVCINLSLRITGASIIWEGSSFKIIQRTERHYRNFIEKMIFCFSDRYTQLFLPQISKLPRLINHPIIQKEMPHSERAFFKKPKNEYVRHATMVYTPYVHYAPAPGYMGGVFHNNQQFRYPENLDKKKINEIRIFITGGSAAWGCLMPDNKSTISAFLEEEFKKFPDKNYFFRVINAACGGYHTTDERIWIFNRITEFEPDVIISYSGYNDIYNVYRVKQDLFSALHNEGSYFYWAYREYEYYNNRDFILKITPDFFHFFYTPNDFPRKTIKNIHIISSYLNSIGVKYIFVLQPFRSDNPEECLIMAEKLEKELKQVSKLFNFKFISYRNFFLNQEEYFIDLCHLGDKGNKVIACNLYRELIPVIYEIIKNKKGVSNEKKQIY